MFVAILHVVLLFVDHVLVFGESHAVPARRTPLLQACGPLYNGLPNGNPDGDIVDIKVLFCLGLVLGGGEDDNNRETNMITQNPFKKKSRQSQLLMQHNLNW